MPSTWSNSPPARLTRFGAGSRTTPSDTAEIEVIRCIGSATSFARGRRTSPTGNEPASRPRSAPTRPTSKWRSPGGSSQFVAGGWESNVDREVGVVRGSWVWRHDISPVAPEKGKLSHNTVTLAVKMIVVDRPSIAKVAANLGWRGTPSVMPWWLPPPTSPPLTADWTGSPR